MKRLIEPSSLADENCISDPFYYRLKGDHDEFDEGGWMCFDNEDEAKAWAKENQHLLADTRYIVELNKMVRYLMAESNPLSPEWHRFHFCFLYIKGYDRATKELQIEPEDYRKDETVYLTGMREGWRCYLNHMATGLGGKQ